MGMGMRIFFFVSNVMLVGGVNSGGWDGLEETEGWREILNDCMTDGRGHCIIRRVRENLLTGRKGMVKEGKHATGFG